MIDLRELKERRDEIAANIKNRGMKVDIDQIIELQEERAQLLKRVDELRSKRNENAAKMKGKLDSDVRAQLIEEGKALKDEISQDETLLKEVEERYLSLAKTIPNQVSLTICLLRINMQQPRQPLKYQLKIPEEDDK